MPDQIRIRLLTVAAGPDFTLQPGVLELESAQAEAMIAAGHALRIEPEAPAGAREAPEPGDAEAGAQREEALAPAAEREPQPRPPEVATAPPQRTPEADDGLAAERAGAAAAAAGKPLTANPYDGRSAQGRAWVRGWRSRAPETR